MRVGPSLFYCQLLDEQRKTTKSLAQNVAVRTV